jgi:hypothetical protein
MIKNDWMSSNGDLISWDTYEGNVKVWDVHHFVGIAEIENNFINNSFEKEIE